MSLRFHEIAEARHQILNPFTTVKLELLGQICALTPDTRVLDLACGKGELLCRWARDHGVHGVGVDVSETFLTAARLRAEDFHVADQVRFDLGDAGAGPVEPRDFSVVSCLGATWIGDGLAGTVELMRGSLAPDGLLAIGEPYWTGEPSEEACRALEIPLDTFTTLHGTAERLADCGLELLELVTANQDDWDRYVASQWWTMSDWLRANPDDPDAEGLRKFLDTSRTSYLAHQRDRLGWGVFVARPSR